MQHLTNWRQEALFCVILRKIYFSNKATYSHIKPLNMWRYLTTLGKIWDNIEPHCATLRQVALFLLITKNHYELLYQNLNIKSNKFPAIFIYFILIKIILKKNYITKIKEFR